MPIFGPVKCDGTTGGKTLVVMSPAGGAFCCVKGAPGLTLACGGAAAVSSKPSAWRRWARRDRSSEPYGVAKIFARAESRPPPSNELPVRPAPPPSKRSKKSTYCLRIVAPVYATKITDLPLRVIPRNHGHAFRYLRQTRLLVGQSDGAKNSARLGPAGKNQRGPGHFFLPPFFGGLPRLVP